MATILVAGPATLGLVLWIPGSPYEGDWDSEVGLPNKIISKWWQLKYFFSNVHPEFLRMMMIQFDYFAIFFKEVGEFNHQLDMSLGHVEIMLKTSLPVATTTWESSFCHDLGC